jgi:hypothetical protein
LERSRWRRRPSPALVVACLALFVALGGTVLAATKIDGRTIKVKSLPGNRLKVGSLPLNRLAPGTFSGDRLAPKSIKGSQIDITTLGQVPSADHATSADSARHAETATAADHATDAAKINGRTVGCDGGEREFAGACWTTQPSAMAVTLMEAGSGCAIEGGELPSGITLRVFLQQPGMRIGVSGEWTNQVTAPDTTNFGSMVLEANGIFQPVQANASRQYRCVTPLLH